MKAKAEQLQYLIDRLPSDNSHYGQNEMEEIAADYEKILNEISSNPRYEPQLAMYYSELGHIKEKMAQVRSSIQEDGTDALFSEARLQLYEDMKAVISLIGFAE